MLQVLQSLLSQSRRQNADEAVVLTVVVLGQRLEGLVREFAGSSSRGFGDFAERHAGSMEDAYHRPAAVVAACEDRIRQSQETPHQVQPLGGIGFRHLIDDGSALRFQIVDQRPPVLPVDEGARPRDRRQPFADLLATSPGLSAPASSSRRRRLAAALPALISISNSARRAAPNASRFFAFSVLFEATLIRPGFHV